MSLKVFIAIVVAALVVACSGDGPTPPATDVVTSSLPADHKTVTPTPNSADETGADTIIVEAESYCRINYGAGSDDALNTVPELDSLNDDVGPGPRARWDALNYVRWTPDGSRILFDVSREPYFGSVSLYGVTAEPSPDVSPPSLEKIVDPERTFAPSFQSRAPLRGRGGTMIYFDVSPDGSHIVYSECAFTYHEGRWIYEYEVMLSRLDGTGDTVRLTENTFFDNFPAWSPDGNRIAFLTSPLPTWTRPGLGRLRIYTLPENPTLEGTFQDIELPLSDKLGNSDLVGKAAIRWSPDGQRIAFVTFEYLLSEDQVTRSRIYNSGVYTVNADGTDLTTITEYAASGPAWSPDAQRIAVVTYNSESAEIVEGWRRLDFNVDPANLIELNTFAADGSNPVVVNTDWLVSWEIQPGGFREVRTSSGETETYSYYLPVWSDPVFPWVGDLSWSPDGSEILLESSAVRVPFDGSPLSMPFPECIISEHIHPELPTYWHPSYDGEGLPMLAAWSPDGSRIAVRLADVNYTYSGIDIEENTTSALLYVVNRDGTSPRLLAVQGVGEKVRSVDYGRMVESVTVNHPPGGDFSCW